VIVVLINHSNLYTGRVPWLNINVAIISGEHKGTLGLVKDVRRCDSQSGLNVRVELQKGTPYGVNPTIWIDYAYIRDAKYVALSSFNLT
jgi:hypothetical protein